MVYEVDEQIVGGNELCALMVRRALCARQVKSGAGRGAAYPSLAPG